MSSRLCGVALATAGMDYEEEDLYSEEDSSAQSLDSTDDSIPFAQGSGAERCVVCLASSDSALLRDLQRDQA